MSQPTVSRALRGLPTVSKATKERVLAAARQLSYVASDQGRALSTRTTRRVAVVSEELTNPFYPELVEPIRAALHAHEYATVVVTDTDGGLSLEGLADGSYDGVVLTTTLRTSTLPRALMERSIPHVLANRVLDELGSPTCSIDNVAGGAAVGELLFELGHRRVACIEGPSATSTGRDRARGLRMTLAAHGLQVESDLTRMAAFSHAAGRAAAMELLSLVDPPTALVCGNDVLAIGALSAARELNIGVPGKLTVVGFDDISMASWSIIDLTTVRCDLAEMGRKTVEILMEQMKSGTIDPVVHVLLPRLVLRGTHGPGQTAAP